MNAIYYNDLLNIISRILLEGPKRRDDLDKHIKIRLRLLGYANNKKLLTANIYAVLNDLLNKQLVVRKHPDGPNRLPTYQLRKDYAKTLKDEIRR